MKRIATITEAKKTTLRVGEAYMPDVDDKDDRKAAEKIRRIAEEVNKRVKS